MEYERAHLEGLHGKVTDVDADPWGDWAAVLTEGRETWVHSAAGRFRAERYCRQPLVRLFDAEYLLLVDRREHPRGSPNAWLHERGGRLVAEWCVGDAVADVVCFEGLVAVTYFDQAFGDERGFDGVSVFNRVGTPVAHYNRFGSATVVDCYCATRCASQRLAFLVYPGFTLVELDLTDWRETCWEVPGSVRGASGVTSWRGDYIFHGSYTDRSPLVAWSPGESEGIAVGTFDGALRGLGDGRLLSVEPEGYGVLSFR